MLDQVVLQGCVFAHLFQERSIWTQTKLCLYLRACVCALVCNVCEGSIAGIKTLAD